MASSCYHRNETHEPTFLWYDMERTENEKIMGGTQTPRHQGDLISLLTKIEGILRQRAGWFHKPTFYFKITKVCYNWYRLRCHGIHAKFLKGWFGHSNVIGKIHTQTHQAILKFCLRNLTGFNVGITNGRNLLCTPLRWLHAAWYTYHVSCRLV
jgi:hypothetical protein